MEERIFMINGIEVTYLEFLFYAHIVVKADENGIAEFPITDITKDMVSIGDPDRNSKMVLEAMVDLADKKLIRFAKLGDVNDEKNTPFNEVKVKCKAWSRQDEYL